MSNQKGIQRSLESTIRDYLLDGRSPDLSFFEYEFSIVVQKWDESNQTIGNTKAVFKNLTTLTRDLQEKIGPGLYSIRVLYRNPYRPGWGVVEIEKFQIADSAQIMH
jgi:hypothetical protein